MSKGFIGVKGFIRPQKGPYSSELILLGAFFEVHADWRAEKSRSFSEFVLKIALVAILH